MSIFGKPRQFVSETAHEANRRNQIQMAPMTLEQLRSLGVSEDSKLKLEYFFYTNTDEKAAALSAALRELGYAVDQGAKAADKKQRVVTGWTKPIRMSTEVVSSWSGEMCDLGYANDCEFDGWGTTPEQ